MLRMTKRCPRDPGYIPMLRRPQKPIPRGGFAELCDTPPQRPVSEAPTRYVDPAATKTSLDLLIMEPPCQYYPNIESGS
jgi:hypothetical protein